MVAWPCERGADMDDWLIWLAFGAVVIRTIVEGVRKRRKARADAVTAYQAEDEAELDREGTLALLVRDRSRYARNYAADMLNKGLTAAERERYRQKYEDAESRGLVDLLTIKDEFYRGVASHGVIDLLLAGDELERSKKSLPHTRRVDSGLDCVHSL